MSAELAKHVNQELRRSVGCPVRLGDARRWRGRGHLTGLRAGTESQGRLLTHVADSDIAPDTGRAVFF